MRPGSDTVQENHHLEVEDLTVTHGEAKLVDRVGFRIERGTILALLGPSGAGKTTLLRSLNRLIDLDERLEVSGSIRIDGQDIRDSRVDPNILRQRVGMIFQKPVVFPGSIRDNAVFGVRHLGLRPRFEEDETVRRVLIQAGLHDEVVSRLHRPASELSQGQQQRLCIARALGIEPEIILFDEPTSSLDPRSTGVIEAAIRSLGEERCVVLVTHDLEQARRVAHRVGLMHEGRLVELSDAQEFFGNPQHEITKEYLGRGSTRGV